jgi:hypothetical protein
VRRFGGVRVHFVLFAHSFAVLLRKRQRQSHSRHNSIVTI